jgi:hypothetical protein
MYAYQTPNSEGGQSGNLIAERSREWGNKYEHMTNVCALNCGSIAGKLVGVNNEVTTKAYRSAYDQLEATMKQMIARVRSGGGPVTVLGGGC